MLHYIPDSELDRFIEEDVPYGDLTTRLLGIGGRRGEIVYSTRHETTLCCTEEAARILDKLGAATTMMVPSGTLLPAGTAFLTAQGRPMRCIQAGKSLSTSLSTPRAWPAGRQPS